MRKPASYSRLALSVLLCLLPVIIALYYLIPNREEKSPYSAVGKASGIRAESSAPEESGKAATAPGGAVQEEGSIEEIKKKALGDPDPGERVVAVQELADMEDSSRARAILLNVVRTDSEAEVRAAAIEALDELDSVSFDMLSQIALNDPAPSLRIMAIERIGESEEEKKRAVGILRQVARKDKDEEVKQAALDLLEEMESR